MNIIIHIYTSSKNVGDKYPFNIWSKVDRSSVHGVHFIIILCFPFHTQSKQFTSTSKGTSTHIILQTLPAYPYTHTRAYIWYNITGPTSAIDIMFVVRANTSPRVYTYINKLPFELYITTPFFFRSWGSLLCKLSSV